MKRIILIETSTALCSVALAENGAVTAYRESSAPKAHASLTAVFVQEVLSERGLKLTDCDAVCVSKGPGSYTGLRVGVSTAKGLCFGSGLPLLAVGTLDTLVAQAEIPGQAGNDVNYGQAGNDANYGQAGNDVNYGQAGNDVNYGQAGNDVNYGQAGHDVNYGQAGNDVNYGQAGNDVNYGQAGNDVNYGQAGHGPNSGQTAVIPDLIRNPRYIIPMIDARRMEVYSAVFDRCVTPDDPSVILSDSEGSAQYTQIVPTAPVIVEENSFAEYLEQGPCLFIGDGAGKCADVIKHTNAHFCQCNPKASAMLAPAMAAFEKGDFCDVAYFEPFYLKEFVATVSKKKLF